MATVSLYEKFKTADIIAEALSDWDVDVVFGIPGDGINRFIEALGRRQDKIKLILVTHEEAAAFDIFVNRITRYIQSFFD